MDTRVELALESSSSVAFADLDIIIGERYHHVLGKSNSYDVRTIERRRTDDLHKRTLHSKVLENKTYIAIVICSTTFWFC